MIKPIKTTNYSQAITGLKEAVKTVIQVQDGRTAETLYRRVGNMLDVTLHKPDSVQEKMTQADVTSELFKLSSKLYASSLKFNRSPY